MDNACAHPKLIITEFLEGRATHRWTNGEYAFSEEYIFIKRVVEDCPDCDYYVEITDVSKLPEEIRRRIEKAREFESNSLHPSDLM